MNRLTFTLLALACIFQSCSTSKKTNGNSEVKTSTTKAAPVTKAASSIPARKINTKDVEAKDVVQFAQTLIGVKYKYGSAVKEEGFDCSGFITYVFKHFNIAVPRSSRDFTNAGTTVELADSKKGDLILFTGYDTKGWIVGHMGMITENKRGDVRFIHAPSTNSKGVMISGMNDYFVKRFVKVIRVFE